MMLSLTPSAAMPQTLQATPPPDSPATLLVLLHGWGANAQDMQPLAQALGPVLTQALVLAPQGFEPAASSPGGRQWFDVQGMTLANRAQRVAQVLPRLAQWLREAQQYSGVPPERTVLAGFSQGGSLAVELALACDGLAARVLAFAGRCASLPTHAPQRTALHFLLGGADPFLPADHALSTVQQLRALGAEATLDLSHGLGHAIDAVLLQKAQQRLTEAATA